MAETTINLQDGLTLGETTYTKVVLRTPTAGDLLDAQTEAERPVMTPTGYELLASPSAMSIGVLRRQVKRLENGNGIKIDGPLEIDQLKRLSTADLDVLNAEAEQLDSAVAREVHKRGRDSGAGGGNEDG